MPWAASPGHAPAQQPGAQAPLPAELPLPGEPPLPQQPPLANGRTHQVRCIAAFTSPHLTSPQCSPAQPPKEPFVRDISSVKCMLYPDDMRRIQKCKER